MQTKKKKKKTLPNTRRKNCAEKDTRAKKGYAETKRKGLPTSVFEQRVSSGPRKGKVLEGGKEARNGGRGERTKRKGDNSYETQ